MTNLKAAVWRRLCPNGQRPRTNIAVFRLGKRDTAGQKFSELLGQIVCWQGLYEAKGFSDITKAFLLHRGGAKKTNGCAKKIANVSPTYTIDLLVFALDLVKPT